MILLIALLVLLAAIGLGPGQSQSLGPLPAPPRFEAAVGDSLALRSPRAAFVARGVVAKGRQPARPIARHGDGGGPEAAVAPSRAVAVVGGGESAPVPAPAPAPIPVVVPVETPAQSPSSAPVATAPSSGGSGAVAGGPIAASVEPEPVCEGDEYTITATVIDGEEDEEGEGARLEIVLLRQGSDGSSEELRLEGDLEDLESLVVKLNGEGGCVSVQIQSSGEGEAAVGPAAAAEGGEDPPEPSPR
jgi:hypothetical protein